MSLRIVRIIARLNVGGPAIHTVLLTDGLIARGFESTLVTGVVSESEGDMEYYAQQRNVVPVVIAELGNSAGPLQTLRALGRLIRLLGRTRPHIIHTHTMKAGGLGRAAALVHNARAWVRGEPRARLVHTFHGHLFHGYFSAPVSRLFVLAERMLARWTDRIVTVSDAVARELVDRYRICPVDRVTVVPLGFDFDWVADLDHRAGELRARHGIPADATVIGIVGRLTGVKNHPLLFDAVARTGRKDVWICVIGDGERRASLEADAYARGLEARVIFTGWQRQAARIYADLDVVCISSRNEGTPVALIEAMAAGRAFVATRVGGVPDLAVGEATRHPAGFDVHANGVLVEPENADALSAALDYVIGRPEMRRAMGAVGQAAVLKRFSKERLLDETEAMYRRLAGASEER
jgi:glycosyltransferase involved in cell wall biosynthesis